MTDDQLLAFRFDCGATWLNLLATRGRAFSGSPVERLCSVERLAVWLETSELTPGREPTPADLEDALRLREMLRPLALATVDGQSPPEDSASALAKFIADNDDPLRLDVLDRLTRAAPSTTAAALGRIARQAAEYLTGPERHTLKICPEHDCRGVFADPADRRRWCPAPACASRGRVRALRARRSASPA